MTTDEKLAAILAAIQTDPGNRGLAKIPNDNLFTATVGDFQAACRSLAKQNEPSITIDTGFFIPSGKPPAYETDGPLGAIFLLRALRLCYWLPDVNISSKPGCLPAILAGAKMFDPKAHFDQYCDGYLGEIASVFVGHRFFDRKTTHAIALEHCGRASDGKYYSMRGNDISQHTSALDADYQHSLGYITIGIGDGGNEIGMGKIPHDTIVKNIPNGDLIHCRVPTNYLIVAGVSNWGAYALAAGVLVLRGVKPPPDLFDPDREREILEVMVREGPLVDGVTGQQTATVDGLAWEEYIKPLIRIREILEMP